MMNIDIRIEKPYGNPSENTLNFNTNLDYVPFFLIPKFQVDSKYPHFGIDLFSTRLSSSYKPKQLTFLLAVKLYIFSLVA